MHWALLHVEWLDPNWLKHLFFFPRQCLKAQVEKNITLIGFELSIDPAKSFEAALWVRRQSQLPFIASSTGCRNKTHSWTHHHMTMRAHRESVQCPLIRFSVTSSDSENCPYLGSTVTSHYLRSRLKCLHWNARVWQISYGDFPGSCHMLVMNLFLTSLKSLQLSE